MEILESKIITILGLSNQETLDPKEPRTELEDKTKEQGGDLLTSLGPAQIHHTPVGISTHGETDWVIFDVERHPQIKAGRFSAPSSPLRELRRIDRTGVHFDRLFIAHELPIGSVAQIKSNHGINWEKIIGPPAIDVRIRPITRTFAKAFALRDKGTHSHSHSLRRDGETAVKPLKNLVFGCVSESGRSSAGEIGYWFLLTSWS